MNKRTLFVGTLLFSSGMCALVYQVVWFREFRLVFGASHPATAAVLAVFMGGLGLGNYLLGKRVDRVANPLLMYAGLELAISLVCAVSPLLTDLARGLYVAMGGQMTLGTFAATLVRLLLAALVLGVPTILMGGTLPAAARMVTLGGDSSRREIGWLYGLNTIGAVIGATASTFFLVEALGTRSTLWLACLVNLLTAIAARELARRLASPESRPQTSGGAARHDQARALRSERANEARAKERAEVSIDASAAPAPTLIYASACLVGFAFFVMELVWYRMLGPLLGGTTFTFGLILIVALTGIGIGGALYPLVFRTRTPLLRHFAWTCGLEALGIAIPFALGDRLAIFSAILRNLGVYGFYGEALGWGAIAAIVVLPAAIVSGIQFPLLIALVGRGDVHVGRQVGLAFGWNTVGAIVGSLAGGFGVLPGLGAIGTWRAVVWLLSGLGAATLLASMRVERGLARFLACAGVLALSLFCLTAIGPTAAWRHSAIGAGRGVIVDWTTNGVRDWQNRQRRHIIWEADGVEASVGLNGQNSLAFFVNGKSDGSAIFDAPTQIMAGLTGALLHGNAKSALVVGLGTGETTGWLAEVPTMDRVDVVELEPAIDEMARRCAIVNHNVLSHLKVNRIYTDAREVLLTTKSKYDLIISEPSNPYRAGVANLYTQEYYRAAQARLHERGMFCQFLQAYEIDAKTVRTVLQTLRSVFRHVEVWETKPQDMLLVCADQPLAYSVSELRSRITTEPYKSALAVAWRTSDLEGVLARFTAGAALVDVLVERQPEPLNTDDKNHIEFGFARTVGQLTGFSMPVMRDAAVKTKAQRPNLEGGPVDWELVEDRRLSAYVIEINTVLIPVDSSEAQRSRALAWTAYQRIAMREVLEQWAKQSRDPSGAWELLMIAHAHAELGDGEATRWIDELRKLQPLEAEALFAIYLWRKEKLDEAAKSLEKVYTGLRNDPWGNVRVMSAAMTLAVDLSKENKERGARLFAALGEPFAVYVHEEHRKQVRFQVAQTLGLPAVAEAMKAYEPNPMWNKQFLAARYEAYKHTGDPLLAKAEADVLEFFGNASEERLLPE